MLHLDFRSNYYSNDIKVFCGIKLKSYHSLKHITLMTKHKTLSKVNVSLKIIVVTNVLICVNQECQIK